MTQRLQIFFFLLSTLPVHAQLQLPAAVDTVLLEQQLELLKSEKDHENYLNSIFQADQHFRGPDENVTNDARNIFQLILYARRYPERARHPRFVEVLWIVMRHVPYRNMYRELFGLAWRAYREGSLSEDSMRGVLIEERLAISQYHFPDKYNSYPLPEALRELGLNEGPPRIDRLWAAYRAGEDRRVEPKQKRRFYVMVDEAGTPLKGRAPVVVYEAPDGLIFLSTLLDNGNFTESRQLLYAANGMTVRPEDRSPNVEVFVTEKDITIQYYEGKLIRRYRAASELRKP